MKNKKVGTNTQTSTMVSNSPETTGSSQSTSSFDNETAFESSSSTDSDVRKAEKDIFQKDRRTSTIKIIESNSRFYLGLPKDTFMLVKLLETWTKTNYVHILITFKKIRLNDAFVRLAIDFGVVAGTVSKMFSSTVPKLANIFKSFIFFPTKDIVLKKMPLPFRYNYHKVNCIIDCFEIEVEAPSNPLMQSLTWSEYKKCNTAKYLISCTPHGFINFVSEGFGGRALDNKIVKESGFLQKLPSNIQVMADRGFKQVEILLSEHNCSLVRPPSVTSTIKPSKDQVRLAKQIAALGIHVERIIRRVREFHFLEMHSCIDNNFIHLLDDIVMICCGIVNVQEAI